MDTNYFDPKLIASLNNLELQAQKVVEGFIAGLHKSPFHGFSVEFSQHRPYLNGDSLRFIDWKVFARTDRYYVKQFEQETNLRCHILIDNSKSMQFGPSNFNKFKYASILGSALAFLMIRQQDAVGLFLFDDEIRNRINPRSVPSLLPQFYSTIENAKPGGDTQISRVLHQVAGQIHRRSLVIILSDLLDDPEEVMKGMRHFKHDQHEVLVFHLMNPRELYLDYSGEVVFEDLETNDRLKTNPAYIKQIYENKMQEFLDYYRTQCDRHQISYNLIHTNTPLDKALIRFLLKRKRLF